MVERKEVEALLAACERIRDKNLDPIKFSPIVPAPTLAALCQAWLALDEALVGEFEHVTESVAYVHFDYETDTSEANGQRVRIVKEPSEGRTKQ